MSLNKSKISEILSSIFSDQNGEKFETNKKKAENNHKYVETEQHAIEHLVDQ